MALKGQKTKSDFLEWERFQLLLHQLERDGECKFCLLITIGCYSGLRISDLLKLRWKDLINQDHLALIEQKTKKERKIELNDHVKELVKRLYQQESMNALIFLNRYGKKAVSIQYVNQKLKEIFKKYEIKGNYSSHFMRKTLGRRVWSQNNYSEQSLIMLGQIFNHSSIQTTKIYLGIREQEIQNIYLNL